MKSYKQECMYTQNIKIKFAKLIQKVNVILKKITKMTYLKHSPIYRNRKG